MVVKCDYYRIGKDSYLEGDVVKENLVGLCYSKNGNSVAIFEKCYCEDISKEYKDKFVKNCKFKDAIKILEKRSLERISAHKVRN